MPLSSVDIYPGICFKHAGERRYSDMPVSTFRMLATMYRRQRWRRGKFRSLVDDEYTPRNSLKDDGGGTPVLEP